MKSEPDRLIHIHRMHTVHAVESRDSRRSLGLRVRTLSYPNTEPSPPSLHILKTFLSNHPRR
ncbi:hypothetical protein YC2023_092482 [Brassica napus]